MQGRGADRMEDVSCGHGAEARGRRYSRTLLVLGMGVAAVAVLSLMLGRYPMGVTDVLGMLASRVVPVQGGWSAQQESLFFNVRLPRVVLALMVGCSLSAAGAAFQGVFQNPLVSPDFLGASQGAALGACVAILFSLGSLATSLASFAVSMASVAIVLAVSTRAKGNRILATVLAGVMVSSLFQAGVSYTKLVADPNAQLQAITFWLMGSLTSARFRDIALMGVPAVVGNVGLFVLRWHINVLTMGDDEALSLGVDAQRVRVACIFCATLVTAACVSVTGIIGWVGLVVPHLARGLVGVDYRRLIPASMVLGAGFLLAVDDVARLATTAEIPIGILTAFVGAPFFVRLITRGRRR